MLEMLLAEYAIETLIFGAIFAFLVVKEVTRAFDWIKTRFIKPRVEQIQVDLQHEQRCMRNEALVKALMETNAAQDKAIASLTDMVKDLIESDKDAIKSWITRMHHKLMEIGWVDDYSLQCIEARFAHYQKFGGNSFVLDLMTDIRALPHTPPEHR